MNVSDTVNVQNFVCLKCGEDFDAATSITTKEDPSWARPSPGECAICASCKHVMVVDESGNVLREMNDIEREEAENDIVLAYILANMDKYDEDPKVNFDMAKTRAN